MSQQGPASHHASRRSSRSPTGDEQVSPSSVRYGHPGSHDVRPNQAIVPHTNGEHRLQHIPPRTLGVHGILNPSEPHYLALGGGGGGHLQPSGPGESAAPVSTPGSTPRTFAALRSFPSGPPVSTSLPGTPVGPMTPLGGPSSERNSPTASYPFPAINNPRRMLSPGPPRAASFSAAGPPREMDTRHLPSMPTASPAKRPYPSEDPEDPRSQLQTLHHMPPATHMATSIPARTLSQPAGQGTQHPQSMSPLMPGSVAARLPPQQMTTQPSFLPEIPPGPPFPGASPQMEGVPSWTELIKRHGVGGAMITEGQQAYMALPGTDAPIPVQVDYSQASKKADEKRQRNAVASTRHRRKKKIIQEENTKQLQELRDERRQMEIRIEELTRQRDFYREERNRLRDVVLQTPGIQGHAAGPPSPSSTRSSIAERSPLLAGPQAPSASQGYASETSSAERPTQRRRTDEHPDFSMPVYGTPTGVPLGMPPGAPSSHSSSAQSTRLSPIQNQPYGVPARPSSTASAGSTERLPPLRSMEGPPPGPGLGPGQGQEQDPITGQWMPVQPRPRETGWATFPRRPPEGPAR